MLQLVSPYDHPLPPLATEPERGGVAVLLNARAKAVNEGVRRALSGVVPPRTSSSPGATRRPPRSPTPWWPAATGPSSPAAATAPSSPGSTASSTPPQQRHARPPRFGVLALGTGNAVAEMVGATPRRHAEDLARYLAGGAIALAPPRPRHLRRPPHPVRRRGRRRRGAQRLHLAQGAAGRHAAPGARHRPHRLRPGRGAPLGPARPDGPDPHLLRDRQHRPPGLAARRHTAAAPASPSPTASSSTPAPARWRRPAPSPTTASG